MKTSRTLLNMGVAALISVTAIALTFGNAMAQFAYLGGQWTSQYQCPSGQFYPITVRIDQSGQQISGVKITADPCVAAGQTAFSGYLTGNMGQLTCYYVYDPGTATSGNPGSALGAILQGVANALAPQSYAIGTTSGTLQVIDANSFEACTLRFVRSGVAPSVGVGSPQTGPWQGSPTYGSTAPWPPPVTPQQPYPYTPPWQSPVAPPTRAPSAQLQPPTYSGDDANQRYIFRVNGQLNDAYGLQAQLVFYFQYLHRPTQTWTDLRAKTGSQYRAATGNVALYTNLSVAFNPYDLGGLSLQIPYSELNMKGPDFPWQRGEKYQMRAWAEVQVSGTSVGSSTPVHFDYTQNDP